MAESTELGMCVHPSQIRILLIRVRGRYQSGREEATFGTNVENSDEQHRSEKPTPLLDQLFLGCTRRECKPNQNLLEGYRMMFASRISAGATESCQILEEEMNK